MNKFLVILLILVAKTLAFDDYTHSDSLSSETTLTDSTTAVAAVVATAGDGGASPTHEESAEHKAMTAETHHTHHGLSRYLRWTLDGKFEQMEDVPKGVARKEMGVNRYGVPIPRNDDFNGLAIIDGSWDDKYPYKQHPIGWKGGSMQEKWVFDMMHKTSYPNKEREQYFVEVPIGHYGFHSSSYALERWLGWKGLCIGSDPGFLFELATMRKCQVVQAVVRESDNYLLEMSDDYHSKLKSVYSSMIPNDPPDSGINHFFRTVRLQTILDYVEAPTTIAYLDVKHIVGDQELFENFDFKKYTFLFITIDRPNTILHSLLASHGYFYMTKTNPNGNLIYVHRDVPDKYDDSGYFKSFLSWDRNDQKIFASCYKKCCTAWQRSCHDYVYYPIWEEKKDESKTLRVR